MISSFRDAFRLPDLKRRILFTLGILFLFRLGAHLPCPGIDSAKLAGSFGQGGVFDFLDLVAGGALRRFSIFALGVAPYINSSIVMQLLVVIVPFLEKLQKEGEEGRKTITKWTRWGTVLFAALQAYGMTYWLQSLGVFTDASLLNRFLVVLTITAGSVAMMWLGEIISDHGIGNGISLLIFAGIVARLPASVVQTFSMLRLGEINIVSVLMMLIVIIAVIAGVIAMQEGQRRLPVQYAKRVVGRRVYGGQSTFIPLKVNQAGVIPIIFASSVLIFPGTIAKFFPGDVAKSISGMFSPDSFVYMTLYALLVVFFTYFYTAVIFNPVDVANNMKKNGGFILGIRPGRPTSDYIEKVMSRITLTGGIFLAGIALLPVVLTRFLNWNTFYFGGTAVLIVVGVALDTVHQIEAQLLVRHYEGILKKRGKDLFKL